MATSRSDSAREALVQGRPPAARARGRAVTAALACEAVSLAAQGSTVGVALSTADTLSARCISVPRTNALYISAGVSAVLGMAMMGGIVAVYTRGVGFSQHLRGLLRERIVCALLLAMLAAGVAAREYLPLVSCIVVTALVVVVDSFMAAYRDEKRVGWVAAGAAAVVMVNYTNLALAGASCKSQPVAETASFTLSTLLMARLVRITYFQYRLQRHSYFGAFNVDFERFLRGEMRLVAMDDLGGE